MTNKLFVCFLMFVAVIFFACEKTQPPVITAVPEVDVLSIPLGKIQIEFQVESSSPLKSVAVYHFKNNEFQVLDTIVYTTNNNFELLYNKNFINLAVPGDEVVVKVVAITASGESSTLLKKVVFKMEQNPLLENQFFYSHDNTIFNGYSFLNFDAVTVDSSNINTCDINEYTPLNDTLFTPFAVNYQWASPNGGLFAPIAGSFYETNLEDLPVIFENSAFGNSTGTLSEGDVLIFKSNTDNYYLILLKDIYEGPLGGRYSFDVRY